MMLLIAVVLAFAAGVVVGAVIMATGLHNYYGNGGR